MRHVLTAQPAAMSLALEEAGAFPVRTLGEGVVLAEGAHTPAHPVFLRHMCPAAVEVPLTGEPDDIAALLAGLSPFVEAMDPAKPFSVQTRILEGFHPAYKRFDVNTPLAERLTAKGLTLDVKAPAQAVSVTLAEGMGWLGVSDVADNLSDWAGGARRFKWEAGQISRAEFKLLEALEAFRMEPADGEHALDLGAAPGGWTRILRRRGLYVVAVDPARLDERLMRDKRVTYYPGTAQAYFRNAGRFDLMVNDMRMDSAESAALMVEGAGCLVEKGRAILTLKLPDAPDSWAERVRQAQDVLSGAYQTIGCRQLFHNRSEVTFALERP